MKWILNMFFPPLPTALEQATKELAAAERKLLEAQTDLEYSAASVQFRKAQIARLRAYINEETS